MRAWFYRAVLRLLPERFRRDYGEQILADLEESHRRVVKESGAGSAAVFCFRASLDVLRTALREHRDGRASGRRSPRRAQSADTLRRNLRWALRGLTSKPGFTLVVVLTLGLGIGANSAIFMVAYEVLLRPLPFEDPERLVVIKKTDLESGERSSSVSAGDFEAWRISSESFESMAAFVETSLNLTGAGDPERLLLHRASRGLFRVLRVRPMLGRVFTAEEDRAGGPKAVILTHGLWQRRFGARADIVGTTVILDDEPHEVVGVLPRGFHFPSRESELFAPLAMDEEERSNLRSRYLEVVARLRDGVTREAASDELETVAARLREAFPESNANEGVALVPLQGDLVAGARTPLIVLVIAVGCILMIACVNVANLLLVRAAGRRREVALRVALGASGRQILGQFLTEAMVLSLVGGCVGVVLSAWTHRLFLSFAPPHLVVERSTMGLTVLGFALVLSLFVGLGFGLLPAIDWVRRSKGTSGTALSDRTGGIGGGDRRLRRLFVVGEVALALVLLVAAGLITQSYRRLRAVNPGFQAEQVVTMRLELSRTKYAEHERRIGFYREVLDRVERLPGVVSAGFVSMLPLTFRGGATSFEIEGGEAAGRPDAFAVFRSVTPDYFRAMGIPLLRGRGLARGDDDRAPKVILVNETLERTFFPDGAVGAPVAIWSDSFQVVGVVADVRELELSGEARPTIYVPVLQRSFGWFDPRDLAVRTRSDPASVVAEIRAVIHAVDPDQPVSSVRTMMEVVEGSVSSQRLQMILLAVFGATALLLAALGIYGVLSHSVAQRTSEIGIRMAMGARPGDVIGMVMKRGIRWTSVGAALGLVAALILMPLLATMLYEVAPLNWSTMVAVTLLLAVVATTACLLPGLRAARLDPTDALRRN